MEVLAGAVRIAVLMGIIAGGIWLGNKAIVMWPPKE